MSFCLINKPKDLFTSVYNYPCINPPSRVFREGIVQLREFLDCD